MPERSGEISGEFSGEIGGETADARAVRVAGLLAELGCSTVVLEGATYAARITDLPGELIRRGSGEVCGLPCGVRVVFSAEGARWYASEADAAGVERCLRRGGG